MNFKSPDINCVCGIRVFRIFKTNPYQNVIRPYNSQVINNSYNISVSCGTSDSRTYSPNITTQNRNCTINMFVHKMVQHTCGFALFPLCSGCAFWSTVPSQTLCPPRSTRSRWADGTSRTCSSLWTRDSWERKEWGVMTSCLLGSR